MANVQPEHGHTDISNKLVEQFARCRFSGQEWQIIWALWNKTWRWHKKSDRIPLSQFSKMTGIDRRKVNVLLNGSNKHKGLVEKNIINRIDTQKGDKKIITYCFQKDFHLQL